MVDRINSLWANVWLSTQNGLKREEGQAVAEYALVLALVAVGVIVALTLLKTNISSKLTSIANSIGP